MMSELSGVSRKCVTLVLALCAALVWTVAVSAEVSSTSTGRVPRVALIIDDLGYLLKAGERTVNLNGLVACAVLPHTPYATRIAESAHAAGKEVLLHLPLQSVEEYRTAAVGAIEIDTTKSQLNRILAIDLASVPHVVGVNNHMGSLLTQHPGHMKWLMDEMSLHGNLFFVDSYTSDSSVALQLAQEQGVPSIRRDVFLDNTPTTAAIDAEFQRLKRLAREQGVAVGIGHPYPETLAYLEAALPQLRAEGFELVSVTEAIGAQVVRQTTSVAGKPHEH